MHEATADGLILASGGVETATLLQRTSAEGGHPLALFLDYGQRPAAMERKAVATQCAALGLPWEELPMAGVTEPFHADSDRRYHVPLPHRNLVALSLALSLADQRGLPRLIMGITADDAGAIPSGGPDFLAQFRHLAATLSDVVIDAPFAELTKAAVIQEGVRSGVDFGRSYSCLLGRTTPCGACPQCRKRSAAFAEADVTDPPPTLGE